MDRNFANLTGQKFGRLIVIRRMDNDKWGKSHWLCRCNCGKEKIIRSSSLRSGNTKSCGCLQKEKVTKYGAYKKKLRKNTKYPKWTDTEIQILKIYYPNGGAKNCSGKLSHTNKNIKIKAQELNIIAYGIQGVRKDNQ